MAKLYPRILYFISGMVPTPEQTEEADSFGPGVAFRNAGLIHPDAPIEEADGVAGDVPESYKEALPHVDDREAVNARMLARDPNAKFMDSRANKQAARETDEQRAARVENALARGQRRSPVNDRNNDPVMPSERTGQYGGPRVTHADPAAPNDGWGTNPETLNDAAGRGQGVGDTGGAGDDAGTADLGSQGAGGPGTRAVPEAPASGAGNPRAPDAKPKGKHGK